MAAWQHDAHLLPKSVLLHLYPKLPEQLDRETFDDTEWWENYQPSPSCIASLESFALEYRSWQESARTWGRENGNLIRIGYENDKVYDIHLRFDVSDLDSGFLEGVVAFALCCDSVLLTSGMRIILPDVQELRVELKGSRAALFVTDPKRFFETL